MLKINRLGNQVGYQIRMESKRSKNTKLLFCTTGVILRRLQDDHELKSITHVIVDEVHERQVQTDVLLIALRQLLRTTRRDLKVILVRLCFCFAFFTFHSIEDFYDPCLHISFSTCTYSSPSVHTDKTVLFCT